MNWGPWVESSKWAPDAGLARPCCWAVYVELLTFETVDTIDHLLLKYSSLWKMRGRTSQSGACTEPVSVSQAGSTRIPQSGVHANIDHHSGHKVWRRWGGAARKSQFSEERWRSMAEAPFGLALTRLWRDLEEYLTYTSYNLTVLSWHQTSSPLCRTFFLISREHVSDEFMLANEEGMPLKSDYFRFCVRWSEAKLWWKEQGKLSPNTS